MLADIEMLMVRGCEGYTALLGMISIISLLSSYIELLFQVEKVVELLWRLFTSFRPFVLWIFLDRVEFNENKNKNMLTFFFRIGSKSLDNRKKIYSFIQKFMLLEHTRNSFASLSAVLFLILALQTGENLLFAH